MEILGEQLALKSDNIIDKANQLLASPREPAIKKAFLDEIKASKGKPWFVFEITPPDLTYQIVNPFRNETSNNMSWIDDDEVVQAADSLITALPQIVTVTKQFTAAPEDKKAEENLKA